MNATQSASNIQELVMEIKSFSQWQTDYWRSIIFSYKHHIEMLYEKKLTYWGTSNKNRKGPPDQIKTVKE